MATSGGAAKRLDLLQTEAVWIKRRSVRAQRSAVTFKGRLRACNLFEVEKVSKVEADIQQHRPVDSSLEESVYWADFDFPSEAQDVQVSELVKDSDINKTVSTWLRKRHTAGNAEHSEKALQYEENDIVLAATNDGRFYPAEVMNVQTLPGATQLLVRFIDAPPWHAATSVIPDARHVYAVGWDSPLLRDNNGKAILLTKVHKAKQAGKTKGTSSEHQSLGPKRKRDGKERKDRANRVNERTINNEDAQFRDHSQDERSSLPTAEAPRISHGISYASGHDHAVGNLPSIAGGSSEVTNVQQDVDDRIHFEENEPDFHTLHMRYFTDENKDPLDVLSRPSRVRGKQKTSPKQPPESGHRQEQPASTTQVAQNAVHPVEAASPSTYPVLFQETDAAPADGDIPSQEAAATPMQPSQHTPVDSSTYATTSYTAGPSLVGNHQTQMLPWQFAASPPIFNFIPIYPVAEQEPTANVSDAAAITFQPLDQSTPPVTLPSGYSMDVETNAQGQIVDPFPMILDQPLPQNLRHPGRYRVHPCTYQVAATASPYQQQPAQVSRPPADQVYQQQQPAQVHQQQYTPAPAQNANTLPRNHLGQNLRQTALLNSAFASTAGARPVSRVDAALTPSHAYRPGNTLAPQASQPLPVRGAGPTNGTGRFGDLQYSRGNVNHHPQSGTTTNQAQGSTMSGTHYYGHQPNNSNTTSIPQPALVDHCTTCAGNRGYIAQMVDACRNKAGLKWKDYMVYDLKKIARSLRLMGLRNAKKGEAQDQIRRFLEDHGHLQPGGGKTGSQHNRGPASTISAEDRQASLANVHQFLGEDIERAASRMATTKNPTHTPQALPSCVSEQEGTSAANAICIDDDGSPSAANPTSATQQHDPSPSSTAANCNIDAPVNSIDHSRLGVPAGPTNTAAEPAREEHFNIKAAENALVPLINITPPQVASPSTGNHIITMASGSSPLAHPATGLPAAPLSSTATDNAPNSAAAPSQLSGAAPINAMGRFYATHGTGRNNAINLDVPEAHFGEQARKAHLNPGRGRK